ncbi:MAG: starch-binding protein [Ruminococcaceae bacterium]|nr:starch-binding protein [Oscillospiraceae bacterium]
MSKFKRIAALVLVFALAISIGIVGISASETEVAEVSADTTNTGITVYFKSEDTVPYIYYWNALPKNLETDYPGVKMTLDNSQEGGNWYKYTFKDSTKINMLFTSGKSDLEGQLSTELTRNTGTWWIKNNKCYSYNPDIPREITDSRDFREDTIYFVITTRFYDGDTGNNVHCWDDKQANNPDSDPAWRGDFKGLADKLDYIKALGFSAIWITPVVTNASGYDYHGYHAMDFASVDVRYESDNFTYQDFIDACHEKDMKVVQDVVWQHTGNFGESFFCPVFEKDTTKDLANLEECMVPTDYLLEACGVSTPEEYWALKPQQQYDTRLNLMKNTASAAGANNSTGTHPDTTDYGMHKVSTDPKYNANNYYHTGYFQSLNWDDWTCKYCQIAGDCVDLNTENPAVAKYLTDTYANYIDMGVDAFRVDTVRHISRLSLNMIFNDPLNEAAQAMGYDDFYMFGEICCRYSQVWYRDHACESVQFYTWDETDPSYKNKWNFNVNATAEEINENMNLTFDHYKKYDGVGNQPTSTNAFLNGITYHEPDYSKSSGLGAIDFQMHWCFNDAGGAFGIAKAEDKYFNDSTWNVVYVESHDYSPDRSQSTRYTGGTQAWAENLSLMFTFRGIPCLYYGGEVEFKKGVVIDVGPNAPLENTGRAYFGDYLEGSVTATDFSEYTATGEVAKTLASPLAKHITKLNAVRRAIPALQKGQYTTDSKYVSGNMAYIRRFTDAKEGVDSLALVTVSGGATFKNIPNGKYIDAITGDVQNVTNGTLNVPSIGTANARVYVCCASGFTGITGAVGETGLTYLK